MCATTDVDRMPEIAKGPSLDYLLGNARAVRNRGLGFVHDTDGCDAELRGGGGGSEMEGGLGF